MTFWNNYGSCSCMCGIFGVGKNLFAISAIGFCYGGKKRGNKNVNEEDVDNF